MIVAPSEQVVFSAAARWTLEGLLQRLRVLLAGRVADAYVFGSYARGTADQDSDVDLLLIADTTAPWPRRAQAFDDLWAELGPVDVLVYTPQEWHQMQASKHPFLEATASERMAVFGVQSLTVARPASDS